MKHALVIARPGDRSFTASVAETYRRTVESLGQETVTRDLCRMGFDPRMAADEIPGAPQAAPRPDAAAERAILAGCDVFAFFYPFWLNAPPAMLKGYLERVFGFGFAYGSEGHSFNPLLKGRRMISFTSSGAPGDWLKKTGAMDAVQTLFDRYFAELCGLTLLDHIHFGGITPGASEFFVQARLGEVGEAVCAHFGSPAGRFS